MPVLPLVGSTSTVSFVIVPSRSPASIMLKPMRSLTLPPGWRLSSLATTVAPAPSITGSSGRAGVCPPTSVPSLPFLARPGGSRVPASRLVLLLFPLSVAGHQGRTWALGLRGYRELDCFPQELPTQ